jgi:hypothetical protein
MSRKPKPKPKKPEPPPIALADQLISFELLAERWLMHPAVARRRVREAKIPILRLSYKTSRLRMSDVLRFEDESITGPPKVQTEAGEAVRKCLAESRAAKKAQAAQEVAK